MLSGEWELVGGNRRNKNGNGNGSDSSKNKTEKAGTSKQAEKTPAPKEAARNIQKFKLNTNFDESEDFSFNDQQAAPTQSSSKPSHKTTSKKSTPARPKTLKEAVTKLNLSELQNLSKVLRRQFSDKPLVWLKDMASFLNVKLNPSTPVDSAYRQEGGQNSPLEYVSTPIREFLVCAVQNCSVDVLAQFHRHCFTCMLHENMRGLPVHGYAIFLQVLGNVCREACIQYYKDYIPLLKMYDNHPRPGLTYVWLLSHTIYTAASAKQYSTAVTMWMEGLVPLLGSKHYSALVAQCGKEMVSKMDSLFHMISAPVKPTVKKNKQQKQPSSRTNNVVEVVVSANQLLFLMDIALASVTEIPRAIIKQLIDILNKLKVLCTHNCISGSAKESVILFQKLLPKLSSSVTPTVYQQIASICGACLENHETECLKAWSDMLLRHLLPSAKLLKVLNSDQNSSAVLSSPKVYKTLQDFQKSTAAVMAEDAQAREFNREVRKVLTTVSEGTKAKSSSGFKSRTRRSTLGYIFRILFYVSVVSISLGYYSVALNNKSDADFDKTLVGRAALATGFKSEARKIVHDFALFSNSSAINIKAWGVQTQQVMEPYVIGLQSGLQSTVEWVNDKAPVLTASVKSYSSSAWETVKPICSTAVDKVSSVLNTESIGYAFSEVRKTMLTGLASLQQMVSGTK